VGVKTRLLDDFLGEEVVITTTLMAAVQTENGDMAEVPHGIEGVLVDFDDEFILVGSNFQATPQIVNRYYVLSVSLVDQTSEVMFDPSKPKITDMN
jgi:hypothetical protein